ncbi:Acyl-acyl carrier protein thioesterase ATL4, chloroplastic [Zea mays]|uniref:Acyl-acyl carrier protein thioesterase ATL4, chloroplastic n=1 Tax=Zea mays TaxID=4577 RepID=A0A3L6FRY7_MAIZE|nr:acyl-acyl carrier protein thioesterase ATL4, chloroplastic [Zea mays]PWZ36834.1 Acyl-acyl carrier protein thioesterase ATL4, chloroplastic [Zea mays]|eukprot:XP_008669044.1 acyl-acyl carrier protein thioesterase ATL4, chloroplastic [Zea mays]
MQQQMAGLVHHQAIGMVSFSSGANARHHVAVHAGRARLGRVTAAARPKYCPLRGAAAVAAPLASGRELLDQHTRPSNTTSSQQLTTTVRKDKFFEIEMEVRDDELDEYGVVNNAIYASYLHSGRDVVLEKLGISVDYWTSTGNAMALSELNLKYFAPLRSGDRFVVKVKPVQIKGVRMIVEHMIEALPDRKLVMEGRATVVCLNKDFRPTRVFPELAARAKEVFSCKVA